MLRNSAGLHAALSGHGHDGSARPPLRPRAEARRRESQEQDPRGLWRRARTGSRSVGAASESAEAGTAVGKRAGKMEECSTRSWHLALDPCQRIGSARRSTPARALGSWALGQIASGGWSWLAIAGVGPRWPNDGGGGGGAGTGAGLVSHVKTCAGTRRLRGPHPARSGLVSLPRAGQVKRTRRGAQQRPRFEKVWSAPVVARRRARPPRPLVSIMPAPKRASITTLVARALTRPESFWSPTRTRPRTRLEQATACFPDAAAALAVEGRRTWARAQSCWDADAGAPESPTASVAWPLERGEQQDPHAGRTLARWNAAGRAEGQARQHSSVAQHSSAEQEKSVQLRRHGWVACSCMRRRRTTGQCVGRPTGRRVLLFACISRAR